MKKMLTQVYEEIGLSTVRKYLPMRSSIDGLRAKEGVFLSLRLLDGNEGGPGSASRKVLSENFYWLPDGKGQYSGLEKMGAADLSVKARVLRPGVIRVELSAAAGAPVAFFNRISLIDPQTKLRLLPVFYSDNYVSVAPGSVRSVDMEYQPVVNGGLPLVNVSGWNVRERQVVPIAGQAR